MSITWDRGIVLVLQGAFRPRKEAAATSGCQSVNHGSNYHLRRCWKEKPKTGYFCNNEKSASDPNLYLYRIVGEAKHTETDETLVVYQALYGNFQMYVRPISMFLSPVDRVKYPQAKQAFRFERCKYENGMWSPVSRG